MASKSTSDEISLNPANVDGTEIFRASKKIGGKWLNFKFTFTGLKNWILSFISVPPFSTQLQSDWTEADTNSVRYIRNKPTMPSPNYRSYIANLQQTGTNAPTATVLNSGDANFLGTLVWTYNSAGNYTGTLVGAFPDASKVWIASLSMNGNITVIGRVPRITYGDADSIRLEAFSIAANLQNQSLPQDGTLGSASTYTSIEIRVYI